MADMVQRLRAEAEKQSQPCMTVEIAAMLNDAKSGNVHSNVLAHGMVAVVALLESMDRNLEFIASEIGDGGRLDRIIDGIRGIETELAEVRDRLPGKGLR